MRAGLLVPVLGLGGALMAEVPGDRPCDALAAVQAALEAGVELRLADTAWTEGEARFDGARAALRPELSAQGALAAGSQWRQGGPRADNRSSEVSLTLRQPLLDAPGWRNLRSQAMGAYAAGLSWEQVSQQLAADTLLACVELLRAQEGLANEEGQYAMARALGEATRARKDLGELTRVDLARAESRTALAEARVETARSRLETARWRLRERTGLQAPEPFAAFAFAPLAGGGDGAPEIPAVEAAAARTEAARRALAAARAAHWPRLDLEATAARSWDGLAGGSWLDDRGGRLVLSVPLFDGGRRRAAVAAAGAQAEARAAEEQDARSRQSCRAQEARAALARAELAAAACARACADAALALAGVEEGFRAGTAGAQELLAARDDLRSARAERLDARARGLEARIAWELARGGLSAGSLPGLVLPAPPEGAP